MLLSSAPVHSPRSLPEALATRAIHPFATVLAGGTDVMVYIEAGALVPSAVLNLWAVPELRGVERTGSGVRLGALTTWTDIVETTGLPDALRECARTIGAVQIQHRGTVGGNVVNASPAGDSLPLWLALDAVFELQSWRGKRRVPADAFWLGYKRTALAPDELLTAVWVPDLQGQVVYRKVGTRLAQAISKVVLAVRVHEHGGVVRHARVAFGSVGPTPLRCAAVERALEGQVLGQAVIARAVAALEIAPIDDVRSTAEYRLQVARNTLRTVLLGFTKRARLA